MSYVSTGATSSFTDMPIPNTGGGTGPIPVKRPTSPAQYTDMPIPGTGGGMGLPTKPATTAPSTAPAAAIAGKPFPWIIPAIGVLAIGGFIFWRRHQKKQQQKGPTP